MSTKEKQEQLVKTLREWQHIENRSVAQTANIIDRTTNPVIRLVMEIIQRDSAMHHRVQQFIIDSFESQHMNLSVEDLTQVWEAIELHIQAEQRTGALVAAAQKALSGTKDVVQQYLISYLGQDERKHDLLLEELALIKKGMYKSA